MRDSLEIMLNNTVPDTCIDIISDTNDSGVMVSKFITEGKVLIAPNEIGNNYNSDYLIYGVLILAVVIAFIWHFMPNRFNTIFSLKAESFKRNENQDPVGVGTLITTIFSLNFILVTGVFLFLVFHTIQPNIFKELSYYQSLLYSYIVLLGLIVFRTVLIYSLAFIFKTENLRRKQVKAARNIFFITGVILLPIIPIVLYTNSLVAVYSVVVIILILQVLRVLKTISIGISDTMFSAFHIILYLCALEIAPVLVLVRLIGNSSVL